MIQITPEITIEEKEIKMDFIRSSGPGGQNVNKVASAVQLRFDVYASPSLPHDVRERLKTIAGKRINEKGILTIDARRFRSQYLNRQDALERLINLIQSSAVKPKFRVKTTPTSGSKRRRLESKKRKSNLKRMRDNVEY